jgi:hypothetical protein
LRTSMRPTIASLDSRAYYQSAWPTRLLGENVKIYTRRRNPHNIKALMVG